MDKPRVFLDSSVIITSLLSSRGGSYYLLSNCGHLFDFYTSEYVIEEIQHVLQEKFSNMTGLRTKLFLILGTTPVIIVPDRPKHEVSRVQKYISNEDAPILASAIATSDILLTLDNEFFNSNVTLFALNRNLHILKPKNLIEKYRGE